MNLKDPKLYINRELSWLKFNTRVLEEAKELDNPLLERLKFIAIYGTNLDEFYMIRVAGLKKLFKYRIRVTGPDKLTPLEQLRAIASNYQDAIEFLSDLALDPPESNENEKEEGKIVLSTIHSAKGLEWKVVFLINLCEGRFPSHFAQDRPDEIEEERRLFYVAATRAKDHLYLCYPSFINIQGAGLMPARPSRFLDEIPERLLEIKRFSDIQKSGFQNRQGKRPASQTVKAASKKGMPAKEAGAASGNGFSPGDRVRHSIFGKGTVIKSIDKVRVKVLFDAAGEKTLRLDYTCLSRL